MTQRMEMQPCPVGRRCLPPHQEFVTYSHQWAGSPARCLHCHQTHEEASSMEHEIVREGCAPDPHRWASVTRLLDR